MLSRLFPTQFDNRYGGYRLAIWMLVPVLLVKLLMGGRSLLDPRFVIQTADGIPLDRFDPEAARVVVYQYQAWGLGLILLALVGVLALVRYRTMLPLVYLLLGLENAGRKVIGWTQSAATAASHSTPLPAFALNVALIAILVVGFALSLAGRRAGEGRP